VRNRADSGSARGLVVPHDCASLEAGLEKILDDPAFAARLRAGCGEVARSLGWPSRSPRMESLYQELVSEAASDEGLRVILAHLRGQLVRAGEVLAPNTSQLRDKSVLRCQLAASNRIAVRGRLK